MRFLVRWNEDDEQKAFLLANIVMYIPMGILLPLLCRYLKHILVSLPIAVGSSIFIEAIQLKYQLGFCQLDDVAANSTEFLVGYLVFLIFYDVYLGVSGLVKKCLLAGGAAFVFRVCGGGKSGLCAELFFIGEDLLEENAIAAKGLSERGGAACHHEQHRRQRGHIDQTLIFLCVLYESGARQHEIINMKVEDITYGRVCYIKIFGKGQKYRNAYISKAVALLIKEYCRHYNIRRGYLFTNQKGKPLSSAGVNYIIRRYADIAAEQVPSLWGKHVTAHTFRRSKATHMLQSGMNLVMIQHFLGHDSLKTTEKYLDVGIQDLVTAVNMAQTVVYATYQHWDNNYWNEVLSENRKNVAVT